MKKQIKKSIVDLFNHPAVQSPKDQKKIKGGQEEQTDHIGIEDIIISNNDSESD